MKIRVLGSLLPLLVISSVETSTLTYTLSSTSAGEVEPEIEVRGNVVVPAQVYSPRLFDLPLRLVVRPEVWWANRQRPDLGIRSYDLIHAEPLAYLMYRSHRELWLLFGAGFEQNEVIAQRFDRQPPSGPRALLTFDIDYTFLRDPIRLDREHTVWLESRLRLGPEAFSRIAIGYVTTIGFGFDDLRLAANATALVGRAAFTDEEEGAARVRGLFNDVLYCRGLAAASAEYRIALVRELYKVGLFNDAAVCERRAGSPIFADAIGVAFHAMLLDTFRVTVNVAQGFASGARKDTGVSLGMKQVF